MKKIVSLFLAAGAVFGAATATAQEVTYVEDCSQGLLLNRNQDNWFITARGGANMLISHNDVKADFKNRIGAGAALFVGKWVTPTFGFRFGANWIQPKGATTANGLYRDLKHHNLDNGYSPEKFHAVGPEFDVMINLTNWWCGYKPQRVYNAVLHGGAGAYWTFNHRQKDGDWKWRQAKNTLLFANIGLQNNFRVSKAIDLFIDAQFDVIDMASATGLVSLQAGITYNFANRDWNCPVTAVCPTWKYTDAQGDALTARLAAADSKINDLQRQLNDCLNRPKEKAKAVDCEGLATVYYPINVSTLASREKTILKSVAKVMQNNPNTKYQLTGWADNYTGTEEINARLRNARVEGVKNYLVNCGVNADQLEVGVDNNNLTDFGAQGAPLDRAVTIKIAK